LVASVSNGHQLPGVNQPLKVVARYLEQASSLLPLQEIALANDLHGTS